MRRSLKTLYRNLLKRFGPQHWWPGDTPFEVAVGAILTQNTAWANASKAIGCLKRKRKLTAAALGRLPASRLAPLIRSSGYFNQKAKKLKGFVRYLNRRYGGRMDRMRKVPLGLLRQELLGLPGVGPETADSILLYALGKPLFVVDAYTRRVLARHSLIPWEASYEQIQSLFMKNLPRNPSLFNEYHALLVTLGKNLCHKRRPHCHRCPLRRMGRLRLEPPKESPPGQGISRSGSILL